MNETLPPPTGKATPFPPPAVFLAPRALLGAPPDCPECSAYLGRPVFHLDDVHRLDPPPT